MIHLVLRSQWEGPTGKRVRRLQAPSLLSWFQEIWNRASKDDSFLDELCGPVYGFHTLFDSEPLLDPPKTIEELRERVLERLYVEGDERYLDEHALRVKTDDDEVDLAYMFFDESFPAEKTAFMLHEEFELPESTSSSGFAPRISAKQLGPAGSSEGATWIVLLTGYDSSTFDFEGPTMIRGVRLPQLCEHLRRIEPEAKITRRDESERPKDRFAAKFWRAIRVETDWPRELLLLRSREARDLESALRAYNEFPAYDLGGALIEDAGLGPVDRARSSLDALCGKWKARNPERAAESRFQISDHLCQMAMRLDFEGSYHQWIFFDDLWAAANPDLANGILDWAGRWDVLAGE